MNSNPIVVGVDGTVPSHATVRWAAREAARQGVALRLLHAYDWNWEGARYDGGPEFRDLAEQRAAAVTSSSLDEAHAIAPRVPAEARSVIGDPVPELVAAAGDASLVVLGNRGRGGFASLLLGSVSRRVATHSPGSVVIVRGRTETPVGPVVVGVDDCPAADDVLSTAFEFAAGRGCPLVAIRTYLPPPPLWAADVPPGDLPTPESDAAERDRLSDQLAAWRQKYPRCGSKPWSRISARQRSWSGPRTPPSSSLSAAGTTGH